MLAPLAHCEADDPVTLIEEPFATFDGKLKAFSAQPTETELRDLNTLCLRLPVRDKSPIQIGDGHPQDRRLKLTCMLRFVSVLDRVIAAVSSAIVAAPPPVIRPGDNPPDNSFVLIKKNFLVHLERTRERWATRQILDFLHYDCRNCDPMRMKSIIRGELKSDPDATALIDALSVNLDAR